jgi:hypothetical protein
MPVPVSNFYSAVIRNSKAFRSDVVCKDTALLEPGTRAAVAALLTEAKEEGHDLRLLETYRSQTRQSALFAKHATQLRTVGCHGYGVAVDFGVFIDGVYQGDNKPYVFLRELARKHGLISGQDWGHPKTGGFIDSGHVQRVPVWRQAVLFAGSWYPPTVYDPYTDSAAGGHTDVVRELHPRGGPTLERFRAAGYTGAYPPAGFAPVASPANPHAHAVEALPPPAEPSVAELTMTGELSAWVG